MSHAESGLASEEADDGASSEQSAASLPQHSDRPLQRIVARTTDGAVKRLFALTLSQFIDARVVRGSLDCFALSSTANKRTPRHIRPLVAIGAVMPVSRFEFTNKSSL